MACPRSEILVGLLYFLLEAFFLNWRKCQQALASGGVCTQAARGGVLRFLIVSVWGPPTRSFSGDSVRISIWWPVRTAKIWWFVWAYNAVECEAQCLAFDRLLDIWGYPFLLPHEETLGHKVGSIARTTGSPSPAGVQKIFPGGVLLWKGNMLKSHAFWNWSGAVILNARA